MGQIGSPGGAKETPVREPQGENLGREVSDTPCLSTADRLTVLEQSKGLRAEDPRGTCAHELFQEQAERVPHHVAVVCEDQQLSYAELDRRSNQVAAHLRQLGIGPGNLAGICLNHSVVELIALLG